MDDWKLFALSAVMTAGSAALFFLSGSMAGLVGLLFFGGGGILMAYVRYSSGSRAEERSARVSEVRYGRLPGLSRYTTASGGTVFVGSKREMGIGIAASALFVAAGIAMIVASSTVPAGFTYAGGGGAGMLLLGGLLSVALGGFGLVVGLKVVLTRGLGILLAPEGVYLRTPSGRAWVRWEDLARVRRGGDGVEFEATAPERIALTGWNRFRHENNRRKRGVDVSYPYDALRADGVTVVERIYYYLYYPGERWRLSGPAAPQP